MTSYTPRTNHAQSRITISQRTAKYSAVRRYAKKSALNTPQSATVLFFNISEVSRWRTYDVECCFARHFRLLQPEFLGCAKLKDSARGDVTHTTSHAGGRSLRPGRSPTAHALLQPSVKFCASRTALRILTLFAIVFDQWTKLFERPIYHGHRDPVPLIWRVLCRRRPVVSIEQTRLQKGVVSLRGVGSGGY